MTADKSIPFFNYPALFAEHEEEFMTTVRDVFSRGAFIMQKDLFDFEDQLADYLGCKHAIGVADGTAALTFALKAADIGSGDEVIVSSHTFIATAAAVSHVGATPVVCDCLPDGMMDVASARKMLSGKTKAIMPTQLNGRTTNMDDVKSLADDAGLAIVEDSCQALGASFKGTKAGLFGVAGSYSFFPAKTLGCFGDGGAVVTDDDDAASLIRELRDHGRGEDGKVRQFGGNGRLDNVQAAILSVKLKRYDEMISRRRDVARRYQEGLSDIAELLLPPGPDADNERFDIFQNYEIQARSREAFREHLAKNGVGTIIQWGGWMVHQFDDLRLRSNAPYAEEMSKKYMMLPMHHMLKDSDVDYVIEQTRAFHR